MVQTCCIHVIVHMLFQVTSDSVGVMKTSGAALQTSQQQQQAVLVAAAIADVLQRLPEQEDHLEAAC